LKHDAGLRYVRAETQAPQVPELEDNLVGAVSGKPLVIVMVAAGRLLKSCKTSRNSQIRSMPKNTPISSEMRLTSAD
jgi:hypothetical protein